MKILPLIISPNPLLKEVSKKVEKIDADLQQFMKNMVSTMYAEGGIGLAAVQVGVLKRILVMDVDYQVEDDRNHHNHHHDEDGKCHPKILNANPRYFINPEFLELSSEKSSYKEGCLSFPTSRAEVIRPKKVKVKYLDFDGNEKIEEMDGIDSTCIQHEVDHLNGVVFIDHISRLKREMIMKKMHKINKSK
jgi:peptide deformylase